MNVPAGTRKRTRESPPHRSRSAPRPPPAEGFVLKRSDPERPQPPIGFRDEHPPRRSRPVRAPVDTSVKIPGSPQIHAVVLPRHAVHPRRGPRPKPEYAARRRSTSTWCRSAVIRASLSVAATRAHDQAHSARFSRHRVRSAFRRSCSPWPVRFPPPPPPPRLGRCSAVSQLLPDRPTSHDRPSRDYGLGLPRTTRPSITTRG